MKHLFTVLLVLVLALLVMPVAAQDEETPPFVTVTAVTVDETVDNAPVVVVDELTPESGLYAEFAQIMRDTLMAAIGQMGNIFIIVVAIIALALVVVGLPVFYWMYNSTPAPFKPMVKEGLLGAMTKLQSEVDKAAVAAKENEVDWDDDGWLWLQKMMKTNRTKLETFFAQESTPPVI